MTTAQTLAQTQWIALQTLCYKEIYRVFRIWPQSILPPVITTSLYFTIFGQFIGDRIGDMHGYPYIQFIAPGLIMIAVINNAYMNVSSSFFGAKFSRAIQELLVAPMMCSTIIIGFAIGGIVRALLVTGIIVSVVQCFTALPIQHLGLSLVIIVLTSVVFALAGLVNAIFAEKFDDVSIIPTFVLTPMTYLGGVFVSVRHLGPTWQWLSWGNPVLYIVNALRYSFLGISDIDAKVGIYLLLALSVILYGLCWWLIDRGIGLRS